MSSAPVIVGSLASVILCQTSPGDLDGALLSGALSAIHRSSLSNLKGANLAGPKYQYEKRQKDLAKKKKQEEKRQRKAARKEPDAQEEGQAPPLSGRESAS